MKTLISMMLKEMIMSSPMNQPDLAALLEASRLNPLETVERPPVAIMINGEGGPSPSFTIGNFSLVIGKAKSKKTFLVGVLAAAAISGNVVINIVDGKLPSNKRKVLYFDTEQAKYQAIKSIQRIAVLSGIANPENLLAYGLRKFNPETRLKLIKTAIYDHDDVGLVIIDGGRDLLPTGINDEKLATEVTSDFLRWTEEKELHLIVVLHQNKNDANARGHFGTECVNKAETTLEVQQVGNSDISIVKCVFSRDLPFRDFGFKINGSGIPEPISEALRIANTGNISRFDQVDDLTHKEILYETFSENQQLGYTALLEQIRERFRIRGISLGINNLKRFISIYRESNWVTQSGINRPYSIGDIDLV